MRRRFPHTALLDTTPDGLALIRRCERFAGRWYRCPAGAWTIGYGTTEHLLPGIHRQTLPGSITKAEAERLLRRSLIQVLEPPSNASSAQTSRPTSSPRSTLLRRLNRGDYDGATAEFERWAYAAGQCLRGLVHRRHTVRWDAAARPPGLYLARLQTPAGTAVRTLVRVR
ncbi:MAG: hypothetical protein KatS3mg042_1116 [Rhodothermaceae bacterium]|nr:MAG: hypothetical protein KatS3mg042_1116 [Rhodothermaceae bacterium]